MLGAAGAGFGGRAAVTGRDEGYLVAEPGEGLLVVADEVVVVALVTLVVVVLAGFGVVLVVLHDCPGDACQGAGDRDGGFLLVAPAEPAGQAAEPGAGPVVGAGGGPGRFDHRGAQVLVAFAGGGVFALAGGTPVLSIATSVTPSSASQAAICCSDRQNVLTLFTVTVRWPGAWPGNRTATQMTFLCTSIPATRGWTISIATSCLGPRYWIRARRPRSPHKIEIL